MASPSQGRSSDRPKRSASGKFGKSSKPGKPGFKTGNFKTDKKFGGKPGFKGKPGQRSSDSFDRPSDRYGDRSFDRVDRPSSDSEYRSSAPRPRRDSEGGQRDRRDNYREGRRESYGDYRRERSNDQGGRYERGERRERSDYGDRRERSDYGERRERGERNERNERYERNDRDTRGERDARGDRREWGRDRGERPERNRSDRNTDRRDFRGSRDSRERREPRDQRPQWERGERRERPDRGARPDRGERRDRRDRPDQAGDRFAPTLDTGNDTNEESQLDILYGRHTVLSAIDSERSLNRVWVVQQLRYSGQFLEKLQEAKANGATIDEVSYSWLDRMTNGATHQGIAAQVAPYDYHELDTIIETAKATTEHPVILVADSITDPHNLGAIARTAEAMGLQGLVIPQRRAVGVTSTVMKVAAGALDTLPIARVVNLANALETLKEAGFWVYGLSEKAEKSVQDIKFSGPTVLVLGSEGSGLSLLTQKKCDMLISIPLSGQTPSLNVSVATGMVIYEISRQLRFNRLHIPSENL